MAKQQRFIVKGTNWLTITDTANKYKIHRNTVLKALHAGKLKAEKIDMPGNGIGHWWIIEPESAEAHFGTKTHIIEPPKNPSLLPQELPPTATQTSTATQLLLPFQLFHRLTTFEEHTKQRFDIIHEEIRSLYRLVESFAKQCGYKD